MTASEYDALFKDEDDQSFVRFVQNYLAKDAHKVRGISAAEYVHLCRISWSGCETDEVFCVKLLMDWPRRWRELYKGSARAVVASLRTGVREVLQ